MCGSQNGNHIVRLGPTNIPHLNVAVDIGFVFSVGSFVTAEIVG